MCVCVVCVINKNRKQRNIRLPDESILPHTLHACGLLLVAFACDVIDIWMLPVNSCLVASDADVIGVPDGCD